MNKEITRIKNIINEVNGITDYQIHYTHKKSCQLYYVLKNLETARDVNVDLTNITIYKDFDNFKSSSSVKVSSSYSDEEIKDKIEEAYNNCKYVKNKYYKLPSNENIIQKEYQTNISKDNLNDQALEVAKAIFKADVYENGWINSTEIFLEVEENEFLNSQNVYAKYPKYRLMIEVIPTWKGEKEEVELYLSYESNKIDLDKITTIVNNKLMDAKNRGLATEVENVKDIDVVLGLEETSQICKFFTYDLGYSSQIKKMSHFNLNDDIQQGDECDKLTVTLVPFIEGSSSSAPIDSYGTLLKELNVIENGKVKSLFGDCMNGYYLGVDKPTGGYQNIVVKEGTYTDEMLYKKTHLKCINFSAFQLDFYTGFFGGEVRLGMFYDGKEYKPVSGFSVSGNIYELINKMRFSKDLDVNTGYSGPKYSICKMSVNK